MTAAEVQGIRTKMRDLNRELQTAAERRNSVAERLADASPAARTGYEARLKVLDDRIIGLERELDNAAKQLAAAPASAMTTAGTWQEPDPTILMERIANDLVPIVAILSVFVFAPFTIAISRFFWKRGAALPRPVTDPATIQRLEQLQQAVDTIALEVERISEGQRFVTKLLNERALGAGGAQEGLRLPRQGVPSDRG